MKSKVLLSAFLGVVSFAQCFGEESSIEIKKQENSIRNRIGPTFLWGHVFDHVNAYLGGVRWELENTKPNTVYWGSDALFAAGATKIDVRDFHETATTLLTYGDFGVGYNFQPSFAPHFLLSVYAGPGYRWEKVKNRRSSSWLHLAMSPMVRRSWLNKAFVVLVDNLSESIFISNAGLNDSVLVWEAFTISSAI